METNQDLIEETKAVKLLKSLGYEVKEPAVVIPLDTWCIFSDREIPQVGYGVFGKFKGVCESGYMHMNGDSWKYCKQINFVEL